jgi:allophanate hydrolase
VRKIIEGASRFSAADAFAMLYRLRELAHDIALLWETIDVLVLPTVGRPYRVADLEADPVGPNFNNGAYTNFANPLDLAALAVPNGFHPSGVPMGITLNAPAFSEDYLVGLGARFQAARVQSLGAMDVPVPPYSAAAARSPASKAMPSASNSSISASA